MTNALQTHLKELAATQPVVVTGDAAWLSSVVSLQLSGHQLVLGGVAPLTAWDVLALTYSPTPTVLTRAGRYGKFWWIELQGERKLVVLATHVRLSHHGGGWRETEVQHPTLSGAR